MVSCKILGSRLRTHRQTAHWTQAQMAERLGVTRSAVAQWENGLVWPTVPMLEKISTLFHIPISTLLTDLEELP
jgi:transcriptional regulator with XRE-family HTH domain